MLTNNLIVQYALRRSSILQLTLLVAVLLLPTSLNYYPADYGQRAFVGKVNMDQECPDYYKEDTQQSLRDTHR